MEENKNPQSRNVNLVFDVMPGAGSPRDGREQVTRSVPSSPPPSPTLPPELQPPPDEQQIAEGKRSILPGFLMNWKVLAAIGAVVVLSIAAYFLYPMLTKTTEKEPEVTSPPPQPQSALPPEWVKKYFGTETCADVTQCGPSADPDKDGLGNKDEMNTSTDPLNADSDYDGLADGDELRIYSTDPRSEDTDGDGFGDGREIRNGFSAKLAEKSPMPALEQQEIATNIQTYTQHEPTITFLTLKQFDTRFEVTSTTTPQISLSVEKDLALSGTDSKKILTAANNNNNNGTVSLSIAQVSPATEESIGLAWQTMVASITSTIGKQLAQKTMKIGLASVRVIEYQVYKSGTTEAETHVLRAMFIKQNRLFEFDFRVPDSQWSSKRQMAWISLYSIR